VDWNNGENWKRFPCQFIYNILKHVIEELAASSFTFSIQLVETTDISQCSQVFVFICYVHADAIKEEFLFLSPLWKLQRLSMFWKW
jgi:hypothetical protein